MGDRILDALRRKLEKAELLHLRDHCAQLADRLESALEEASRERELADHYHQEHMNLMWSLTERDEDLVLTKDGQIGIATPRHAPAVPALLEGETYVKTLINAESGVGYHLTLLALRDKRDNWQAQKDWAAGLDADLPNRIESAILQAEMAPRFEKAGYWTNEQHSSEPGWAWYQNFNYGYQYDTHTVYELFACAVRRLPI